jgi:hypothetical protein
LSDEDTNLHHLQPRRTATDPDEQLIQRITESVDLSISRHFQEQNDLLRKQNDLLQNSVQRLIQEVDGVRSGRAEEAFAKVAAVNSNADLPTIEADVCLLYPHTATEIGQIIGLSSHEVGTLLGSHGLNWAGDPTYQEMVRHKDGRQKFWHHTVPERLKAMLIAPPNDKISTANRRVRAIVRKFRAANGLAEVAPLFLVAK